MSRFWERMFDIIFALKSESCRLQKFQRAKVSRNASLVINTKYFLRVLHFVCGKLTRFADGTEALLITLFILAQFQFMTSFST